MGKLIYREKEKTVYQIGGYGSVRQNFKLILEKENEWEEFERS
jgi:3-deoxy-D-manno-octulosonate 8-phosphate phosphatase KdsC-like HAD superfamily phosphatase